MPATLSLSRAAPRDGRSLRPNGPFAFVLGNGFTLLIFLGIAYLQRSPAPEPVPAVDDLRAVSLPPEPPPPPRVTPPAPAEPAATFPGVEAIASDSPVKIAAMPPDLADILPPPPVAPPALIQIGQLHAEFKPRMDFRMGEERIYQASEVDQRPEVIYRGSMPRIPDGVRRMVGDSVPDLVMLVLIDTGGAIKSIQVISSTGNEELDAILTRYYQQWMFTPALKKGRKVKMLLKQELKLRFGGSLLSL